MTARLSDAEIGQVDSAMSEHMYRHSISNNINGMGCDAWCRARALGKALEPILAARLAEAEQAAEQRGAERVLAAVEALADPDAMERALYQHSGLREDLIPLVIVPASNVLRALVARFTENGEGVRDASVAHQQRTALVARWCDGGGG